MANRDFSLLPFTESLQHKTIKQGNWFYIQLSNKLYCSVLSQKKRKVMKTDLKILEYTANIKLDIPYIVYYSAFVI